MNNDFQKAQYLLKQNIWYFIATKLNLFLLVASLVIFQGLSANFFLFYPVVVLVGYRFLFNISRLDNPYKIYLLALHFKFFKKLRNKNV